MPEILRVLIHPHPFFRNDPIGKIWEEWQSKPDTFVVASGNYQGLLDSSILDMQYAQNNLPLVQKSLIVGGQQTNRCVWAYLDTLARHTRIQSKEVSLAIDSHAVLSSNPEVIAETIRRISGLSLH